jgi:hypothetical protein
MPAEAPTSAMKRSTITSMKSSPPRKLSPADALTSMTPSNISRIVERAASQVEHEDLALGGTLLKAIGERRGGRLVQQALDLQAGHFARSLGGLALRVIEVGGNGDDRFVDRLPQKGLCVSLQRLEHQRRQFFGPKGPGTKLKAIAAHVPFEGSDRLARMGQQPLACRQTHHDGAVIVNADRRRRQQRSECVGNEVGFTVTPRADQTVGRAEINPDYHARRTPLDPRPSPMNWVNKPCNCDKFCREIDIRRETCAEKANAASAFDQVKSPKRATRRRKQRGRRS